MIFEQFCNALTRLGLSGTEVQSLPGAPQIWAFRSDRIRWGRVVELNTPMFSNINLLVFPTAGVDAPALGVELTFNGEEIVFAAVAPRMV